jgi:uroporphyrinogen decarboxylase
MADKTSGMTSRERVLAAIEGKPIDRVPVMYWPNCHAAARLVAELYPSRSRLINAAARFFWRKFKNGGEMDAKEIWRALPLVLSPWAVSDYALDLGSDIAEVPYGDAAYWGKLYRENGTIRVRDNAGSIRGIGGIYLEVIEPGIKSIRDLVNFQFNPALEDRHYDRIRKFRSRHPEACICASNFGVQDLPATQFWNMESMLMAMIDYPDEVKAFQQRMADCMIGIGVREVRAGTDLIFIYDDYGYTDRTLISMPMWKEFTYPHLRRMIAAFHEEGAKVMLHSCGYQMPFLPYYAEAGLDVLQTFQPKAGNDFAKAYAEYGDRLTFNTGIDIQLGEMMTPAELREDVLRSYHIAGRKGRHILGMTHMLQYTMPLENMRTLFDTVRGIQDGRYDA